VFLDAIDDQIIVSKYEEEKDDPLEREELPFLKEPKIKISLWSILKDSLGKDLSRITVPVYFNQPLNVL
jgi:oxysterol-binding protein 1